MRPTTADTAAANVVLLSCAAATPFQLFTLGFGTIVGVGWVVAIGTWIRQAGPLGGALAFVIGGVAISVVGLCYAQVSRRHPGSGGELTYAWVTFGPGPAYVTGCVLFFTYVSVVGFLAISAGSVISLLIPSFGHSQVLYLVQGEPVRLGPLVIGLSGLLGLAALNLAGMLATRRFQYWVTFALIASVVAFVVTSLLRSDPTNLLPLFSSNSSEASFAGFLAVLGTTPFWLAGFNVVPQALQETCRNADSRTAGRVIIASILAAAVFKGSVIIATAITSPRSEVLHSAFPLSLAFTRAFSSARMGQAVTVVALAALLSCWNAVFFTTCRILTSMGERALLPSHFSRLTKRAAASPSALALTFVVGLLLTLGGRPLVQPIISAGGTCFGLLFLLTCVVDWRESRARSSNHGWQRAGNLFVAGAGVFLSAVMILLSLDIFGAIKSQRLPISWLMLLGLLVATSAAAIRRLGHDRAFTESSKPSS